MLRGLILAAGEGTRLASIAAPFHKPLMVVNGRSIVSAAVDELKKVDAYDVTVVVAPQNASAVCHVTDGRVDNYVVQPKAISPVDAVDRAMRLYSPHDEIILLMGDNIFGEHDVPRVAHSATHAAVGGRVMPKLDAQRFTRQLEDGTWVEGEDDRGNAQMRVWLGPVMFTAEQWEFARRHEGTSIGRMFNYMQDSLTFVETTSSDLGLPEMYA
jgi:choline kinase